MFANYSPSSSPPSPRSPEEWSALVPSDGAADARAHALQPSRPSLSSSSRALRSSARFNALERGFARRFAPPGAAQLVPSGRTAEELEAHYCALYNKVWATCIAPAWAVVVAVNKLAFPVAVVAEQYLVPLLCWNPKWQTCDFAKAVPTTLSMQYSFFMFVISFIVMCACHLKVDILIAPFVKKCFAAVSSCCCLSCL